MPKLFEFNSNLNCISKIEELLTASCTDLISSENIKMAAVILNKKEKTILSELNSLQKENARLIQKLEELKKILPVKKVDAIPQVIDDFPIGKGYVFPDTGEKKPRLKLAKKEKNKIPDDNPETPTETKAKAVALSAKKSKKVLI